MSLALAILHIGPEPLTLGPSLELHAVEHVPSLDDAATCLALRSYDGLLIRGLPAEAVASELEHWPALAQAVQSAAVVVLLERDDLDLARRLVQRGVQEVVTAEAVLRHSVAAPTEAAASAAPSGHHALGRLMSLAIARKRLELLQRKGGSIDIATGLPTVQQWMDHFTHLCALREREPAPMAAIVLRVDGMAGIEARLGVHATQVLRRKVAVRLRSSLRASDLVGSLGNDAYAVLLTWLLATKDAQLVREKLLREMRRPFSVGGDNLVLGVGSGVAVYPDDARDGPSLLRIAHGAAASNGDLREGTGYAGLGKVGAANDDMLDD